jgi:hypothetical protein
MDGVCASSCSCSALVRPKAPGTCLLSDRRLITIRLSLPALTTAPDLDVVLSSHHPGLVAVIGQAASEPDRTRLVLVTTQVPLACLGGVFTAPAVSVPLVVNRSIRLATRVAPARPVMWQQAGINDSSGPLGRHYSHHSACGQPDMTLHRQMHGHAHDCCWGGR